MASVAARGARIRMKDGGDMDIKDASRPFFQRQLGEIGVYIMVYDATAVDPKEFGSEHFFIMDLMDKLYDQLSKLDPVKVKLSLSKKGHFKGTYFERFEKGIVLALGFDDLDALENVWKLHSNEKLASVMQESLITPTMLKSVGATRIVLSTRMFDDEYTNCKNELVCRKMERLNIKSKASDMDLLRRLKEYQTKFNDNVQTMREIEFNFNKNLEEFIMTLKHILPANHVSIKSLKEFETEMKMARGVNGKKMTHIDKYFEIITKWRSAMLEIDEFACQPLVQMHSVCETEKQKELKTKIHKCCREMQDNLRPDANLQSIRHEEWTQKRLKKEQILFGGLISLIPLGADTAFDINCMLDEYINDYPL